MKALVSAIPTGAVILDARFRLADPAAGRKFYLEGHIPGAQFVDLDTEMSGPKGNGKRGRHPLPDREKFAGLMGKLGVGADTTVVAYDDADHSGAARLWMLLKWLGHDKVYVLNGGLKAWQGELARGEEPSPEPASFPVRDPLVQAVHREELEGRLLVDARAPERYRGDIEPLDPVAGHIPGAENYFYQRLLAEGVLHADRLPLFASAPTFYCGSGVTASVLLLAAYELGRAAAIYPGSWSEWANNL
jgi:thiosulfate/3-mercaptopyruvate sulfurtransferase